jgi:predicted RNase H-like HicB family nuclease
MADQLRVALEIGPKGKKAVAVAPDWPGLSRGAKTGEEAIENLRFYLPRYAQVATLADMSAEFEAIQEIDLVEQYPGTPSTDFWGVSFAFSSIDKQDMSADELERELRLMQACWMFFDDVRSRVSAEMQKGPRGGGRDRDHIVRHAFAAERDWAQKVAVLTPEGAMLTDDGLKEHRHVYCQAIRDYHAQGKLSGKVAKWPLRYLIRHTAYHTLDHAWEMEDKDLTAKAE